MNFKNLPANWSTIPLTDPHHIADVLDIFVGQRDRMVGSLLILICDEARRPVQPLIINDIEAGGPGGITMPSHGLPSMWRTSSPMRRSCARSPGRAAPG